MDRDDSVKCVRPAQQEDAKERGDESAAYFRRRSEEAICAIVEYEVRVAVSRLLAISPDADEEVFLELARQAWRDVSERVTCRSASVVVSSWKVVESSEEPR